MKKKRWLYPVCFLILVCLTIGAIALQNRDLTIGSFLEYVSAGNPYLLAAAVGCMLAYILLEGQALRVLCRAVGYPQSLRSGLMYSASDIYFSAITPSATGGQPASAVLMIRDGIPGAITTSILLMNLALYTLSIIVLGAIGIALNPGLFLSASGFGKLLIVLGICTQIAMLVGFMMLVFHQTLMLKIADFFLRLLKRLHLVRRAEEKREKLLSLEADYRRCAETFHARPGALARAFFLNFLQRLSLLMVPVLTFLATGGKMRDLTRAISAQGMVILGSNSMPLPGGVGVSDYLFLNLFESLAEDPAQLDLLARGISFYGCILLCALALALSLILQKKKGGSQA